MSGRLLRVLLSAVALCVACSITASAQDKPLSKTDVFVGYAWLNPGGELQGTSFKNIPGGFGVSTTYFLTDHFGGTIDTGFHHADDSNLKNVFTLMVGPTVRFGNLNGVIPFAHGLFGLHSLDVPSLGGDTGFGAIAGGGLDLVTKWPRLNLRLIEADMVYGHHALAAGPANHVDNLGARLRTGLVLNFGQMGPPAAPATASCSAQPAEVFEGEPVTITATGNGFNPKKALTYEWSPTGVKVSGTGQTVNVDTKGLQPGTYPVRATVRQNQKVFATCTANVVIKQPRPPQITCAANPNVIQTGDGSNISAQASSPDSRPLTYSYQASAGSVEGSGPNARFNSGNIQPGTATVTCMVSDDRNLSASDNASIRVNAPPPPPPPPSYPEPTEQEKRLALHSVYFATAQPTKANPNGGLVTSQQRTLSDLARDFKSYLAGKPDARLKLEAHADVRGSDAYNQALTERRAGAVKNHLVKQGVPAANIDTEAFGKQQNLTDQQVASQINSDPDLTPGEKQRITKNMKTIVLANNRRVDIVLQIPGRPPEASIRRYPFNAADALSLIGGREKPAPAKKTTAKKSAKSSTTTKKKQ